MRNYRADSDYGVGFASTVIFPVRNFRLPVPQAVYRPFQATYTRGDITREGDGPISVEWVWDVTHVENFASLVRFLFSTETAQHASCYVRTDKRVGFYSRPTQAFAVFSATVWRPQLFGPDGSYENPYQLSVARLTFKNLSEVP